MRIAIAGASGLIGSTLTQHLRDHGHEVVRLVRHAPRDADERRIDSSARTIESPGLSDVDAVVNLAGVGIADGRWTGERKRAMRASRVVTTETIVEALADAPRCKTLLNGSAVGYYGDQGSRELREDDVHGRDYLANLCVAWEKAAGLAPEGVRVVKLRTGHVLSRNGGILGKQRLIYQLGFGGPIGSGEQYVSWISIEDYCRAVEFLLTHSEVSGPVNMTGPTPVPQAEFSRAFAHALGRPAKMPMPLPLASLVFTKEMVQDALLASQNAVPAKLLEHGFQFRHRTVDEAMDAAT